MSDYSSLLEALHRMEAKIESYEIGYKKGWKDALEHAKTLRDPDGLAEIQNLNEALRKKNEKHRELRAQYKWFKDARDMSHDEIVERVTKVMHAEVCCPCDPQGCDWTHTREARYARALADSGLFTWSIPNRDEVTRVLKDTFWPFLAHSPNNPETFWGQATDAILALLEEKKESENGKE